LPSASTSAAVAIDPWFPLVAPESSGFVRDAGWVPWKRATAGEVIDPPIQFEGVAAVMPESTPELLLVAVYGGSCPPLVEIAATATASGAVVALTVDEYVPPPPNACGQILRGWALGLELAELVDPATVELTVTDHR
jgi:hypothetical protein